VPTLQQLLTFPVTTPRSFTDDGEHLLLLSTAPGTNQLYRVPVDGGAGEQLTDLPEPVSGGEAIPRTGRILIAVDTGGNERHQLYLLHGEPGAQPDPFAIDPEAMHIAQVVSPDGGAVAYAYNGRNGLDFDIVVRPTTGSEPRTVAELGGYCTPVAFSPDGRLLVVSRLSERSSDNDLHLVDLESGDVEHLTPHDDEAYFGDVVWRPDSRAFLFVTNTGRDLCAIARYDLASRSYAVAHEDDWDLQCTGDDAGKHLAVEVNEDGFSRLELRDPQTLELRNVLPLPGRGVVEPSSLTFSRDGRLLAYQYASGREPGDAWVYDTERETTTRLTRSADDDMLVDLVDPSLHRFTSFDGESIPVFLYRPQEERAPVIVNIHGGPEAQARPGWGAVNAYWVSRGFAVAVPNIRGSTGYGKRYEHLDDREKRLDSVRDLVALHDWFATQDALDESRVALAGGSYGGYMTLAGLAFHPDRWAAGVDIVGMSSLVTFLENTSIWRRAFREREYGSLEHDRELLESVSPIGRIEAIAVPLLIVHGANDPRVPLSEAQQLHTALTDRGLECELIVYDDEGHGLQKLDNRLDAYTRVADFLERVLAPALRAE
jgi:dipeptidyl aminopeptidase/acylaminoacyl peptidase